MKLSWGLFFSSLYCTAAAATRPTVSPNTARLIIAQRLGLSRFHSIEDPNAETIRHINAYGGRQPRLFGGEDEERSKAHLLIWREDGLASEGPSVVTYDGSSHAQGFAISVAPFPSDNNRLVNDFIAQVESLPAPADPKKKTYTAAQDIAFLLPANLKPSTHNEYLSILRVDKSDDMSPEYMGELFKSVASNHFAVTLVTMPAPSAHSKRSASPWGTYDLPASNAGRRENPEMILSSNANAAPSSSPAPPVSDLEDFPVVISQANDTRPVRGILPSCFASQDACEKRTHGCSGHGECKLLHKGRGEGSNKQADCFACACVPTVVSHDKGMETSKKTTYWGGPACQKKDISIEFWLFVMVGVVLAFLISAGIGLLYSMGAEELPSVIGAGVSGPVRK